jgi:hypothetical protein
LYILLVPQVKSKGLQRCSITLDATYEDTLEIIHETLGCASVAKKPQLSYKLSSASVKSDALNLCGESDWEGLLEEVAEAQKKKKGAVIPIKIIIPDQIL